LLPVGRYRQIHSMRNSSFPETCVLKEIFIGNTVKDKSPLFSHFKS
jgi:hypothetical protein